MAFGDVAVETDQPTLPMLSGAGSRTWVEHSLPLNGDAVIEVGGDGDVDAATDLAGGVVLAGGFRLELVGAASRPAAGPAPAGARAGRACPWRPPRPPRRRCPSSPPAAPVEPPTPPVARPTQAVASTRRSGGGPGGHPGGRCRRRRRAACTSGGSPALPARPRAGRPTSRRRRTIADITLPPPIVGAPRRRADARAGRQPGLARRRQDVRQRPSQPADGGHVRCVRRVPGARFVVGAPRPAAEPRPPAARRRPAWSSSTTSCSSAATPTATATRRGQALRPVKLLGDKVSRSHLEVRFQGWEVLVADCGSTNGTFVVPHPGGQVVGARARTPADGRAGRHRLLRLAVVHRRSDGGRDATCGCASTSSARSRSSPATS